MKTLGLRELSGLFSILLSLSVFGYFLIYSKYLVTHRSLIVCLSVLYLVGVSKRCGICCCIINNIYYDTINKLLHFSLIYLCLTLETGSGHQILTIGVHGAGELPALLTADRRVNFRSGLISWRL